MSEETRTEIVHEMNYVEDIPEEEPEVDDALNEIDLDDNRAIADYYLAKNNMIDPDQLLVEKKEKELKEEIREVVDDKESLIEYLTNLHASIEVMEERIYELEMKLEKKEKQSIPSRSSMGGMSTKGLSQLPFGIF